MDYLDTSNTKYENVKNDLIRRIDNGEFSADGKIPSENEISKSYDVSVITARKAMGELVLEGRIVRIKGKGSFLSSHIKEPSQRESPLSGQGVIPLIMSSYEESDNSMMTIIQGAQNVLSSHGYSMTLECSNRNSKAEAEILERCLRDDVEGVLIFSIDPDANLPHLMALDNAGKPFVMLDRELKSYPCTMVASYNFDGMYKITEHLISLGHRNIAYLANEMPTSVHEQRLRGYEMALRGHGIERSGDFCLTANYPQSNMLPDMIRGQDVTAVICINDRIALEAMEYLKKEGFEIPGDVSVTGFDDSTLSRFAQLTTVRQEFAEIGATGAQKLLELIHGRSGHTHTLLPVELVVRETTGYAKGVDTNSANGTDGDKEAGI